MVILTKSLVADSAKIFWDFLVNKLSENEPSWAISCSK